MQPESRSSLTVPNAAAPGLTQRLRSANGHLKAVIEMVEAGEPYESILNQLEAVQAALRCAGLVLIQCQLEQSVDSLLNDPSPETRARTVSRLSNHV